MADFEASQHKTRVLICDDSAFMRMMLKKLMVENGFDVAGEAGDGKQAVQMYRKLKPDLITMDITMPNMDGIEAVKAIHGEDPLVRIVMVTAIGQRGVIADALNAGASDFIVKPFDPVEVLKTLNKVLKK